MRTGEERKKRLNAFKFGMFIGPFPSDSEMVKIPETVEASTQFNIGKEI